MTERFLTLCMSTERNIFPSPSLPINLRKLYLTDNGRSMLDYSSFDCEPLYIFSLHFPSGLNWTSCSAETQVPASLSCCSTCTTLYPEGSTHQVKDPALWVWQLISPRIQRPDSLSFKREYCLKVLMFLWAGDANFEIGAKIQHFLSADEKGTERCLEWQFIFCKFSKTTFECTPKVVSKGLISWRKI